MKVKWQIILSVLLIVISGVCLWLFFSNNQNVLLTVYNPVTKTNTQYNISKNESIEGLQIESDLAGYTLSGLFYDKSYNNKCNNQTSITKNTTLYLGYIKQIENVGDITNNVYGLKINGKINQSELDFILNCNFKYLEFLTDVSNLNFSKNNSNLKHLVLNQEVISNVNNFSNLQTVESCALVIENSFNNCLQLNSVKLENTVQIANSFNVCKTLTHLDIPNSLQVLNDSFIETPISTVNSKSPNFFATKNALYYKNLDEQVLLKFLDNTESLSVDSLTTKIADKAFYKSKTIKSVTVNAKVGEIGESAFELSSINSLNIQQNSVLKIKSKAFYNCKNLSSVELSKGIERILDYAFSNCGITNLSFSQSVLNSVGNYAFSNCSNLKEVVFNEKQITLENGVFANCKNLETIKDLDVLILSDYTFKNCTSLKNINYLENLQEIKNYAFLNCKALQDISFCSLVSNVGIGSFSGCKNLVTAQFFNLINFAQNLFLGCDNLKSVKSLANVKHFDKSAFDGCLKLDTLEFSGDNFVCSNAVVYNKTQTELLYYAPAKTDTYFNIPSTVTIVNNYSLSQARNLTDITSSSGAFYCEEGVLYTSDKQTLLTYPSAKNNSSFTVPTFVNNISSYAFCNNQNLTDLTISENVLTLQKACLWQNLNLVTLNLGFVGNSLENNQSAFLGWVFGAENYTQNSEFVPVSLLFVTITKQETFSDGAFYGCASLLRITLNNATKINDYMFYNCYALQHIIINNGVESVGKYCMYKCNSLLDIKMYYHKDFFVLKNAFVGTPQYVIVLVYHTEKLETDETYKSCFGDKKFTWQINLIFVK